MEPKKEQRVHQMYEYPSFFLIHNMLWCTIVYQLNFMHPTYSLLIEANYLTQTSQSFSHIVLSYYLYQVLSLS